MADIPEYHTLSDKLKNMREILAIQGSQGNWNLDPYMHGLYNGMEFMLAMAEDREPVFKKAPEKWVADMTDDEMPTADVWRRLSLAQEHKTQKEQQ